MDNSKDFGSPDLQDLLERNKLVFEVNCGIDVTYDHCKCKEAMVKKMSIS